MTANHTGEGLYKIANITVCTDVSRILSQKRRMDTNIFRLHLFNILISTSTHRQNVSRPASMCAPDQYTQHYRRHTEVRLEVVNICSPRTPLPAAVRSLSAGGAQPCHRPTHRRGVSRPASVCDPDQYTQHYRRQAYLVDGCHAAALLKKKNQHCNSDCSNMTPIQLYE